MPRKNEPSSEAAVREIRRRTRRKFSSEEKIRIVLDGLRGEMSMAALFHREGIAANPYYRWSQDFLEAGKSRRSGDTVREATSVATRSRSFGPRTASSKRWWRRSRFKTERSKNSLMGPGGGDGT
jgi:transposase